MTRVIQKTDRAEAPLYHTAVGPSRPADAAIGAASPIQRAQGLNMRGVREQVERLEARERIARIDGAPDIAG
jgi:hypothetical protein